MKLTTLALMTLCLSVCSFSQEQEDHQKTPATKLEAFQARTGIVLIRGYSNVGKIGGIGEVQVDAREFRDGSNPNSPRTTGVSITVKEAGRLERESTSYIDSDEVDSLVKGIEYISHITKDATKLDFFEADYRTKGDLRVTVFNNGKGEVSVAISSGQVGRTTTYVKLADLDKLRALILLAKSKI